MNKEQTEENEPTLLLAVEIGGTKLQPVSGRTSGEIFYRLCCTWQRGDWSAPTDPKDHSDL